MSQYFGIAGYVLIAIGVVFALLSDIPQSSVLAIISATAGLFFVIKENKDKQKEVNWRFYAMIGLVVSGTMLASAGGSSEQTLITLVGAIVVIAGIVIQILPK